MREDELRRIFRRAAFITGLVLVGTLPLSVTAQTPTDPANPGYLADDDDMDDDDGNWGWIGLLGLAGLLGLRQRDKVDVHRAPSRTP